MNREEIFQKASSSAMSHIEARDKKYLDPKERAELFSAFIFAALDIDDAKEVISQPLWGDIMSFCIEMFGAWALEMEAAGDPSMIEFSKVLSRGYYSLHYSYPDGHPALGPDREAHTQLWNTRMEDFV